MGLDDQIPFGKYVFRSIRDILLLDPGYLLWAHENVRGFRLDSDVLKDARHAKHEQRQENFVRLHHRSYGDFEHDDEILEHESLVGWGVGDQ